MCPVSARRGVWVLSFLVVTLLINVPIAHTAWTRNRIENSGIETAAHVVEAKGVPASSPGAWFVVYEFPEDIDPDKQEYTVEVDEETYHYAVTSEQVDVRYLPDDPGAHIVEGEVGNSFGLWLVAFADIALLLMLLLYVFYGRRQDAPLQLLATADVRRCKPSWSLQQLTKDEYVATGEIVVIEDDHIVLETQGGKRIRLVLGDHANEVGYQQPAEIRGRVLP